MISTLSKLVINKYNNVQNCMYLFTFTCDLIYYFNLLIIFIDRKKHQLRIIYQIAIKNSKSIREIKKSNLKKLLI